MENSSSALELSVQMGEALLENGAEISRVQETMERVAQSYRADKFNVYVLTNAVFVNGVENGKNYTTEIKYIKNTRIHIGRISALNHLSREIAEGKYSVESAFARLKEIRDIPYSRLPFATLCCSVCCACYSFLFGGTVFDAMAAFLCGLALEPLLHIMQRRQLSKFLSNLIASSFAALLATILFLTGLGSSPDKIIIGTLIRLVPGVALTTSIRDFFNGDYLSGTIRMIDALIIGVCIGIGSGVVIRLFSLITGGAV